MQSECRYQEQSEGKFYDRQQRSSYTYDEQTKQTKQASKQANKLIVEIPPPVFGGGVFLKRLDLWQKNHNPGL